MTDLTTTPDRPAPPSTGALLVAMQQHEPGMAGHLRRVGRSAVALAAATHPEVLDDPAAVAAFWLHDIGKLAVDAELLTASRTLTPHERRLLAEHPAAGQRLAAAHQLPPGTGTLIRAHHERLDGTGYPDGLAGDEIPVAARILSVADVFDALTSVRSYQRPRSTEQALEELWAVRGRQLDGDLVAAFTTLVDAAQAAAA